MKLRTQILLGALSFLAGLMLLVPAALLQHWARGDNPPRLLELFGLSGTVLSGTLSGVAINQRPALGDLRWRMQPLWLLLGRASFHVDGGRDSAVVDGAVAFSPFSTVRLRNFRMAGSIKPLLAAAGQAFLPVDGQTRLDLNSLKLKNGLPQSVDGSIALQNLAWTLAREPLLLGDYRAELSTENGDSLIKVASVSGPLELSGNGKFTQDQSYEIELKLRPKPETSAMLRNLISGAGAPDLQGYYHIAKRGQLVK